MATIWKNQCPWASGHSILVSRSSVFSNKIIVTFHTVCFCLQPGDDEYTIVPNSKIVVSRTAFKDSSSQYLVDGKKSSYKDVAKLLRGFGIDLDHNRFLILQVRYYIDFLSFFFSLSVSISLSLSLSLSPSIYIYIYISIYIYIYSLWVTL